MGAYLSNTNQQQAEMLEAIGLKSIEDLFSQIPESVKLKNDLNLPEGISEKEVRDTMEQMAQKNTVFKHIFRGAGAYNHYIPSIVKYIVAKEEFVTAYTPYQAEISQGVLQAIFEYQTAICRLTGLDASNASVYDGATAAAEAIAMCRDKKRNTVIVSAAVNPEVLKTIQTYCFGNGMKVVLAALKDGATDSAGLNRMLSSEDVACVYMQQPNYYGIIEDAEEIGRIAHDCGARFIMGCNPVALAIIKTPAECHADIAVGEGQPLGIPLSFGGPYIGFMACTADLIRKLPGRIVGETKDSCGNRAFVLTLQAREQHIRREKARSKICSNQALCALNVTAYVSSLGSRGLTEVAQQCLSKAGYLAEQLQNIGFAPKYKGEYFHEFVTVSENDVSPILNKLAEQGYLGGLPLGEKEILWCATEMNSKQEIDDMICLMKECGE